jgi:hypothetical protein
MLKNRNGKDWDRRLEDLEKELEKLAEGDDVVLDFPVSEEMIAKFASELSPEVETRMWRKVHQRGELSEKLHSALQGFDPARCPFSQLISDTRTRANVPLNELANAVGLEQSQLEDLEAGRVDPLSVTPEVIASLMELFVLTLSAVENSVRCDVGARHVRAGLSQPSRRGQVTREQFDRAMADVSAALGRRDGTLQKVEIPPVFLGGIENILRRRGREDLL